MVLLIPVIFGFFGCALDLTSPAPVTPPASSGLEGQIYRAKKDVEMYEEMLRGQKKNRRALQNKIDNTSIWDEFQRHTNNAVSVLQMKTDKMVGRDQDKLEHMDRRIRETEKYLSFAKDKLEKLEKQQDGGSGGGGGC
jgi:hypothetical protein